MLQFLTPQAARAAFSKHTRGAFSSIDEFLLAAERASTELRAVSVGPRVGPSDIVLVSLMRNEAVRVPAFLDYYRSLGVDRFIIVDNDSGDKTTEILSDAPDVDVWLAGGSFQDFFLQSMLWRTALIHAFARRNWILLADADEFLVYDGMDSHDLHALAEWMDLSGRKRLRAYLIDVFGKEAIRKVVWPSSNPLGAEWFFDPQSYGKRKGRISGGPRSRTFSSRAAPFNNNINKFPLSRFDAASGAPNIHALYPFQLNNDKPFAALLHLKFTADFIEVVNRAVEESQHWRGAQEYRIYQEALKRDPDLSLYNPESRQYCGPESLMDAGLMQRINWSRVEPRTPPTGRRHRVHAVVRDVIGPRFLNLRRSARLARKRLSVR